MRTLTCLAGVLLSVLVGCGSVVTFSDGGGGEGGDGGNGGDGGGPVVPPNPPGCPASGVTFYDECPEQGLTCSYNENGCTVTYSCTVNEECYYGDGSDDDGYGGYGGGCEEYSYWEPTTASCNPPAVDCDSAQAGDKCALPGDSCGNGYECSYEDKWCNENHVWETFYWEDECCYDECCYDGCYCEPYYCPDTLPVDGEYCDACFDSESCYYEVDTECGVLPAYAGCSPETYSWVVEVPNCAFPE